MDVTVAVIARDLKVRDDGTLDILGILTGLRVTAVPYVAPSLTLFLSLSASQAEVGMEKPIEVRLLDADGTPMGSSRARVTMPEPPPGRRSDLNVSFPLTNVPFEKDGDYSFHILIGGDDKRDVPFHINVEKGEQ